MMRIQIAHRNGDQSVIYRLCLVAVIGGLLLAACGGGVDDSVDSDATSTREIELSELATVQAGQSSETEETAEPESTSTMTSTVSPSPTHTEPPTPTSTNTPQPTPTRTPRPTSTPAPTPTPTPVDLGAYLPIGTDMAGPFTILDEQEVDASLFVHKDGFRQGRTRNLGKTDPEAAASTYCAEYDTSEHAKEALDQQYAAIMQNTESFSLTNEDVSRINTPNAYLAGGAMNLNEGQRVTAVVWFQVERVMCYYVILGVPDGDSPPIGFADDAANGVLERLAQASAPTPTPIPDGPDVFEIGQTIRYEDGFSITIKTVEDPVVVNGEAVSPRASIVLIAIEVEACAGSSTDDANINPLDFDISLSDNTRADRSYGLVKEPQLDSGSLFPGECLQGWVTFERHWEPRAVYVIIDPLGYSTIRVKAR